ncbi:MAG TPA: YibE/F family protein [Candidatus Paceibacterota bacterium]
MTPQKIGITLFGLSVLAIALLFGVGGKKGFKSLISLALTIIILMSVIIPLIANGYDPAWVTFIAAIPITVLIIYLTEGFTVLSNISIVAILFNFSLVSLLAYFSISFAGFTGVISDAASVVGGEVGINLQSLLIAGIMLGTLGAIIEMVVTQVATVIEFIEASPHADKKYIYKQSYNVGVAHLGSIINTLFLIYAGILLPLLIVSIGSPNPLSEIIGYEPLSSEIVRTLAGTIGLIIAMPTSTFLAIFWLKRKHE